jgi:hypothetical protein
MSISIGVGPLCLAVTRGNWEEGPPRRARVTRSPTLGVFSGTESRVWAVGTREMKHSFLAELSEARSILVIIIIFCSATGWRDRDLTVHVPGSMCDEQARRVQVKRRLRAAAFHVRAIPGYAPQIAG